jgi:hypothetical protein
MTKASKKQLKQEAQDALLSAMMAQFLRFADEHQSEEFVQAARKEAHRVQKLFGYEPGSWVEG